MRWLDITNHHQLNGPEFEQAPGDGDGQGSLVCCNPWGHRVRRDWATEQQRSFQIPGFRTYFLLGVYYLLTLLFSHSPQSPFLPGVGWGGLKSGGPLKSLFFRLRNGVSHSWQVWWGFIFLGKGPWCLLVGLSVLTSSPPGLWAQADCLAMPPAVEGLRRLSLQSPRFSLQNRHRLWIWDIPHPLVFPPSVLIIQPAIIAGVKLHARDREKHWPCSPNSPNSQKRLPVQVGGEVMLVGCLERRFPSCVPRDRSKTLPAVVNRGRVWLERWKVRSGRVSQGELMASHTEIRLAWGV